MRQAQKKKKKKAKAKAKENSAERKRQQSTDTTFQQPVIWVFACISAFLWTGEKAVDN